MTDDIRDAVEQLANSLQAVLLLSSRLREQLAESAQDAGDLEVAADKAARAIERLRPPDEKNR